jgi:cytochrome c556
VDGNSKQTRIAHTGIILLILALTLALATPVIRHSLWHILQRLQGRADAPASRSSSATDLSAFRDRFAKVRPGPAAAQGREVDTQPGSEPGGEVAAAAGTTQGRGSATTDVGRGASVSGGQSGAPERAAAEQPGDAASTGDVFPRSTIRVPPGASSPASTQAEANAAVEARRGAFKVMDQATRWLVGTLDPSSAAVNRETLRTSALRIETLARLVPDLFSVDTRAFATNTAALPNIWTELAKFDNRADELAGAVSELAQISRTADAVTLRKAAAKALAACGQCHATYTKGVGSTL